MSLILASAVPRPVQLNPNPNRQRRGPSRGTYRSKSDNSGMHRGLPATRSDVQATANDKCIIEWVRSETRPIPPMELRRYGCPSCTKTCDTAYDPAHHRSSSLARSNAKHKHLDHATWHYRTSIIIVSGDRHNMLLRGGCTTHY